MADRVTCCPHCSTSFRITDEQLQTAKGAVRCGSCLQIFRALDHLLDDKGGTNGQPEITAEPAIPELDDLTDDALISDNMDKIEDTQSIALGELSDDFLQQGNFGESKGSLFDRDIKVDNNPERDHTDESWAVDLLDEIEDADDADSKREETAQSTLTEPASEPDYSRATTGTFSAITDDEIEAALGEPASKRKEPIFNVTGERPLSELEAEDSQEDLTALFEEPEPQVFDANADSDDTITDSDHDALLQGIAPAPVEMEWHQEKSRLPIQLLWASLSMVAIALLSAQFLWFNFDEYSRTQPWRDAFSKVCPTLGCTVPSIAAPEQVKAYNLVVRSHPRANKALIIDSILLNQASFEQPFPDFTLTFSNLNGKQLAYRRFTPREYLGGEMAGATTMPIGQPVHISLEVLDPGPEAVNYNATIALD